MEASTRGCVPSTALSDAALCIGQHRSAHRGYSSRGAYTGYHQYVLRPMGGIHGHSLC